MKQFKIAKFIPFPWAYCIKSCVFCHLTAEIWFGRERQIIRNAWQMCVHRCFSSECQLEPWLIHNQSASCGSTVLPQSKNHGIVELSMWRAGKNGTVWVVTVIEKVLNPIWFAWLSYSWGTRILITCWYISNTDDRAEDKTESETFHQKMMGLKGRRVFLKGLRNRSSLEAALLRRAY